MREIASELDGLMIVPPRTPMRSSMRRPRTASTSRDFLSSKPGGAENLAIAHVIELARSTGCRVHILHVSSSDTLPMIATASRRSADHRGDLPALPDLHRRGDPRRRHAVQVLPAQSGRAATGSCSGGPPRRDDRHHRLRPLAVDGRPKCLDIGNSAWPGAASPRCNSAWRGVDQARQRGFDLVDIVPMDVRRRPSRPVCVGRAASTSGTTPTSAFRARRRVRRRRAPLHHKNAITPYDGRPLAGRCAAPGCGASRSTSTTSRWAGS